MNSPCKIRAAERCIPQPRQSTPKIFLFRQGSMYLEARSDVILFISACEKLLIHYRNFVVDDNSVCSEEFYEINSIAEPAGIKIVSFCSAEICFVENFPPSHIE